MRSMRRGEEGEREEEVKRGEKGEGKMEKRGGIEISEFPNKYLTTATAALQRILYASFPMIYFYAEISLHASAMTFELICRYDLKPPTPFYTLESALCWLRVHCTTPE